jgi:hypothetical protein
MWLDQGAKLPTPEEDVLFRRLVMRGPEDDLELRANVKRHAPQLRGK